MELIILACILAVCVIACNNAGHVNKNAVRSRLTRGKIAQYDTLLQNIEAYDGSARGQKRIGGKLK